MWKNNDSWIMLKLHEITYIYEDETKTLFVVIIFEFKMNLIQNWQVWWNSEELIELPWNDKFCSTWISQWMKTWVLAGHLSTEDSIRCINHKCNSVLSYYEIILQLNYEDTLKLNDSYNKVYFTNTNDIIACPCSTCNYVGFVSDKEWNSQFSWEVCGFLWRQPSQMSFKDKSVIIIIRNLLFLNLETFSFLNDVIYGKPWPTVFSKII